MGNWSLLNAALAQRLGEALLQKKWMLSTAESCTGGLVSATITEIAGSSAWFDCGFVTYSNNAKMQLLDVSEKILQSYGAVSEETAQAMAVGALNHSDANLSVSITGIAGPTGGSPQKPVGMVCFAWATRLGVHSSTQYFEGDRHEIRAQAAHYALSGLLTQLGKL